MLRLHTSSVTRSLTTVTRLETLGANDWSPRREYSLVLSAILVCIVTENFMPWTPVISSFVSGGLAGGLISIFANRMFHFRSLRTKFYPKVNDIYSAYVIRMEKPQGSRYVVTVDGKQPSADDAFFVVHRSNFVTGLVEFNELREARTLRKKMIDNSFSAERTPGSIVKLDLQPKADALNICLKTLHKKLTATKGQEKMPDHSPGCEE